MASGLVSPDVVSKASALVGETPENTRNAFDGVIPTVLGGIINKASGANGSSFFSNLLATPGGGANMIDNVGSLFAGGHTTDSTMRTGEGILSSLFGGNLSSIAGSLGSRSGIRTSSATSLLALAAPMLIGFLNRQKEVQGLSTSGLMDKLMGQKNLIAGLVPGVLGTATGAATQVADAGRAAATHAATATTYAAREAREETTSGLRRWGPWLLLAALGIGLITWLMGRSRPIEQGLANLRLPGGVAVNVPEGSINYNLAKYLADTSAGAPRTFVFDHLNFESGTTRLAPESGKTVSDMAAILKAYPTAEVRLDGYTDSTGDPAANKQLSLDRANAIKQQLVASGVDGNRVSTAGMGQDRPVASNDTEEGRARNRRTELVVLHR